MLDIQRPARMVDGLFRRLGAECSALCFDPVIQAAVPDLLVTNRLADGVRAVADWSVADDAGTVTGWPMADRVADAWAHRLGPSQLPAALCPTDGRLSDELADKVVRALLRRAVGRDRSTALAARVIVQAVVLVAVRAACSQIRGVDGRSLRHRSPDDRTRPTPRVDRHRSATSLVTRSRFSPPSRRADISSGSVWTEASHGGSEHVARQRSPAAAHRCVLEPKRGVRAQHPSSPAAPLVKKLRGWPAGIAGLLALALFLLAGIAAHVAGLGRVEVEADVAGEIGWDISVDFIIVRAHQHAVGARTDLLSASAAKGRRRHLPSPSPSRPDRLPPPPLYGPATRDDLWLGKSSQSSLERCIRCPHG